MSASPASNPAIDEFTFPLETIVKKVDQFLVRIQCAIAVTGEVVGPDEMKADFDELYAFAKEAVLTWQMCGMADDEESYYE